MATVLVLTAVDLSGGPGIAEPNEAVPDWVEDPLSDIDGNNMQDPSPIRNPMDPP